MYKTKQTSVTLIPTNYVKYVSSLMKQKQKISNTKNKFQKFKKLSRAIALSTSTSPHKIVLKHQST